ncbi:MAG: hypothetical protein H8E29_02500 [Anaerolineales bacterium]|uniref:Glycosyltransferase RgtA/B/C/D-like domain-containing protein n=1 Tax=Candidatus Desulfolinea nitratireducens TaxID=2841698 RepID=A0A8J6NJN1_9CHLR|nr:hypothetical protein [Candidatus Desulfolinea nitratireducens]
MISSFLQKEKAEKFFVLALMAVIALGILFRARHYLAGRSLWLDEAMIALDIIQLSFWELTQQPLPYQQGAPIGFLFFVKTTTLFFGDSEYAFRLYSLLTSCASLFLIAILAKRYLNKAGTIFSVALFASSSTLIYYSAETKQYMGDVAASLFLLVLLSSQLMKSFSSREIIFFTFTNIMILWFSHSVVFTVAAVGIVLALHYLKQRDKKALSYAIINLSLSGISASLLYWFHLRPLSASDFLRSFWEDAFVPIPPTIQWFGKFWASILQNPLGLDGHSIILFLLLLGGIVFLWRTKWQVALALLLTMAFTFVAGLIQKYPLAERMMLFSVPIFLLFFGAGLDKLSSLIKSKNLSFGITLLLAAYILYSPVSSSFEKLKAPLYREHIRPSMGYIKDHFKEDDTIYVYYFAEPAFLFYLPKYHLENSPYILGGNHQGQPNDFLNEIDELDGRVWFIFSHVHENASINEEDFIVNYLNKRGALDREFRVPGTSVSLYLYELY